jgi:hypothetical protein
VGHRQIDGPAQGLVEDGGQLVSKEELLRCPARGPGSVAARSCYQLALCAASCGGAERAVVAEVVEAAGETGDEAVVVAALEVGLACESSARAEPTEGR